LVFCQKNHEVIVDLKLDYRLAKKLVLYPDLNKMIREIPESFKSGDFDP
jgi:hypothetical protein